MCFAWGVVWARIDQVFEAIGSSLARTGRLRASAVCTLLGWSECVWLVLVVGGFAGLSGRASACSVPVFRYALERWEADPYELVVFHRGGLTAEQRAVVDWLEAQASREVSYPNLGLRLVDLSVEQDASVLELWRGQGEAELPWMVLSLGGGLQGQVSVWSGPLGSEAARVLVDSPARREIAKRILAGESVVWVLLHSGDEVKDEAAAKLLRSQLEILEQNLELPELAEGLGGYMVRTDDEAPLRLAFSMVEVRRDDAGEEAFVAMLLSAEPDLGRFNEPIAFPVFGRGRVLYALVGRGITPDNITEACSFLVGPCSCQVKGGNPGVDMLMAVDWEGLVGEGLVTEAELPPLTGLGEVASEAPVDLSVPPAEAVSGKVGGKLLRNVLVMLGLLVVAMAVALLLVRQRSSGI